MSRNNEQYHELRSDLLNAGLSVGVVDYVLSLKPSKTLYGFLPLFYFILMVSGFLAGIPLWDLFEDSLNHYATEEARNNDAIMYHHNFGLGMIIALFGWIFGAGHTSILLYSLSSRGRASIVSYGILDDRDVIIFDKCKFLEKLVKEQSGEMFVRKFISYSSRLMLIISSVMLVAAAVLIDRELRTFKLYTAEKYLAYPLFPWDTVKSENWSRASLVELGCNHVTGRSASDDVIYIVQFESGRSHRVSDAVPVSGKWLDAIEIIDARLRASGAQFQRWKWLARNPLHPKCLAAQRRRYGREDIRRLYRLLRVGEFSTDEY